MKKVYDNRVQIMTAIIKMSFVLCPTITSRLMNVFVPMLSQSFVTRFHCLIKVLNTKINLYNYLSIVLCLRHDFENYQELLVNHFTQSQIN